MTASCLHCGGACRLTDGAEVYPHRPDLHDKPIFVCDHCDARVGCHPGTTRALGFACDAKTRNACMLLHDRMLDPLWKEEADRKTDRRAAYKFLAKALGIEAHDCHTGMFTLERCRDAWRALQGQTPETIRQWNDARRSFVQEAESDRKRKKHGRRRRRASRDGVKPIAQAAKFTRRVCNGPNIRKSWKTIAFRVDRQDVEQQLHQ
ncbi:MAG: zinc-finger-containing protein [Geminicoccaceae bacterium]